MNTRHAQMILTILREGSFTAAAKALCITQPTLSQTVSKIESQLGESIFARGKTPVTLTEAGKLYVDAARRILQTETQLQEAISQLRGHPTGALRVGMIQSRSNELLPQVVSDFFKAYPDVRLHTYEREAEDLEAMLLRGELDMILLTCDKQNPHLEYRQIASEEIVLVAGKHTAIAQRIPSGSTIGLGQAEHERFIMPTDDYPRRQPFYDLLDVCGVKPEIVMHCDNGDTALRACAHADLVMLCPYISLLCDGGIMQRLSHYHLGTDAYMPPFYMACAKNHPLTPYGETLYLLLSRRFRAMTAYRL